MLRITPWFRGGHSGHIPQTFGDPLWNLLFSFSNYGYPVTDLTPFGVDHVSIFSLFHLHVLGLTWSFVLFYIYLFLTHVFVSSVFGEYVYIHASHSFHDCIDSSPSPSNFIFQDQEFSLGRGGIENRREEIYQKHLGNSSKYSRSAHPSPEYTKTLAGEISIFWEFPHLVPMVNSLYPFELKEFTLLHHGQRWWMDRVQRWISWVITVLNWRPWSFCSSWSTSFILW